MESVWHLRKDARWFDGVPVTAGDFIFKPVAAPRTSRYCQASLEWTFDPIKLWIQIGSTPTCELLLRNYLTGQNIDIRSSRTQDCDPVVSIENGSVGTNPERIFLPDAQRELQIFGRNLIEVVQL